MIDEFFEDEIEVNGEEIATYFINDILTLSTQDEWSWTGNAFHLKGRKEKITLIHLYADETVETDVKSVYRRIS